MEKERLSNLLEGVVILIFGIVVAVCGIGEAIDLWFGIGFTVTGAVLAIVAIITLARGGELPLYPVFLASAHLALGIGLFTHWLSFAVLVNIFVLLLLALGAALLLHGLYSVAKVSQVFGIGEIILGVLLLTFSILYITVPDFRHVFWIIIGILIAVYGAFIAVFALLGKKANAPKKAAKSKK